MSQSYAGYPIVRNEQPGTVRARAIMGAAQPALRARLDASPYNAQYSDTQHLVANYRVPIAMPDSVKVPLDFVRDDWRGLPVSDSETMLSNFMPVFFDRHAHPSLEDVSMSPLVSLAGVNRKLAQIAAHGRPVGGNAMVQVLRELAYAMHRWAYLGPQLALTTEGGEVMSRYGATSMMAVGFEGPSFVGDIFRGCYAYYTPREMRANSLPLPGRRPVPFDPYVQGNVLGLIYSVVPRAWVNDTRVALSSSLHDLCAAAIAPADGADGAAFFDIRTSRGASGAGDVNEAAAESRTADMKDWCVQILPWVSYDAQPPTMEEVYGSTFATAWRAMASGAPEEAMIVPYVRVGTVGPTRLDSMGPGATSASSPGGVGCAHASLFPGGAEGVRAVAPASEPVRVFLERRLSLLTA